MTKPVRGKYTITALSNEISEFEELVNRCRFDEACVYFREHLDAPTLFGLEPSLHRARLLQSIDVGGLSDDESKIFVLYALALSLNLTGGWPNRAIPLYEKHIEIAERVGDISQLSMCLGHYAKALRQTGRFRESEAAALRGLKIIRERGDHLREAVNLYWLGMGLAHRGENELSETALERSLRIFRAKASVQSEGVVNAFLAQRALWLGLYEQAADFAAKGIVIARKLELDESHVDLHGAVKILIACLRMRGEATVQSDPADAEGGEHLLLEALRRAHEIEFVEEELPALRSLALLEYKRGNYDKAREHLADSWSLSKRGDFRLYHADSLNILARVEFSSGQPEKGAAAAMKAFEMSICDGLPFSYQRGLDDASQILNEFGILTPPVKSCAFESVPIIDIEIDPVDEFNAKYAT